MILYKNVDAKDIESILGQGIFSANRAGSNDWEHGRRGSNSKDVVYFFKPFKHGDAFPKPYGLCLIEVDIPDDEVTVSEMAKNDHFREKYEEYTSMKDIVPSEYIRNVYIPRVFREKIESRMQLPDDERIQFCEMTAVANGEICGSFYSRSATGEELEKLGKTSSINSTYDFFFRSTDEKERVIDFSDVKYHFE